MRRIDAVVLHWVGNPGTNAEQNRRYFESLKDGSRKASAHYIIDDHEIVQCIPDDEVAYHVGQPAGVPYTDWARERWGGEHPNWYCIGVEHCHPDWSGVWTDAVMRRSVVLVAGLCLAYNLDADAVVRHFDVTGKECPRHMATNPSKLAEYRERVRALCGERPDPVIE